MTLHIQVVKIHFVKKILYIKYCKLQIHKYCIKAQMQKRIINNSEYLLKKV